MAEPESSLRGVHMHPDIDLLGAGDDVALFDRRGRV